MCNSLAVGTKNTEKVDTDIEVGHFKGQGTWETVKDDFGILNLGDLKKIIFPLTGKGNLGEGVWTGLKEKIWVWNPVGTKAPMGHLGRTG